LTPFKVRQIATTIDDYLYTPDDEIVRGEVVDGKRYTEGDFNRSIMIQEREAYRVKTFMDMIDQKQKTLVFCATQSHAGIIRDLINQVKTSTSPDYCVRVTANDGALGEQYLRTFQDNEKTIPTILTTSQKLSTGVDARNVRNIVLLRPINSMIEFKQIIGRGTRLFDGKDYFTIYDFVKAYEHFNDPEWDGEPLEPDSPRPTGEPPEKPTEPPVIVDPPPSREMVVIKLADGKERRFQHITATSFWGPDGKPMSAAQFVQSLFGVLPQLFQNEDELRRMWSAPETRKRLLDGLEERGFSRDQLASIRSVIDAEASDLFDVLAYVAYVRPPETREERVALRRASILDGLSEGQREFLDFVLSQYIAEGEDELDPAKLPGLLNVKYGSASDGLQRLGASVREVQEAFRGFQGKLYADERKG
jgi:type I restriction enzyme R subunit